MKFRILFLGLMLVCGLVQASVEAKSVSALIESYVKIQLDFDSLKKACNDYDYKIYQVKTQKFSNGITVIDWMVVDRVGTKVDQRFFTFQTTDLEVTAIFQSLGEAADWHGNIAYCKTHNKRMRGSPDDL